ncbi:MAG: PD-(D/E)XK nuclease family transposase [Bacteroidales bacterium]|nr:PD-(D/E)XK nuclease family transposase [Bacteroidales bacterium]
MLYNIIRHAMSHFVNGYGPPGSEQTVLQEPRINMYGKYMFSTYGRMILDKQFKLMFGSPAHKKLLIELLQCLIPGKNISDITYGNTEISGFSIFDKDNVFDIFCHCDDPKADFIVEMQTYPQHNFRDRVLFYSTYPIREQIISPLEEARLRMEMEKKGELPEEEKCRIESYAMHPVYCISILNEKLDHTEECRLRDGLLCSYELRTEDGEMMTDALHFVFLELGRMTCPPEEPWRCKTLLEKLAFSLKYSEVLKKRPDSFTEELLELLFSIAEISKMDLKQRKEFDNAMTTMIDRNAQLVYQYDAGKADGIEEGKAEGKAEAAKNLKGLGVSVEVISRATGLSVETIEKL